MLRTRPDLLLDIGIEAGNNLVIAIYRRKSSEGEDRQVQSLEDQADSLAETARRYGIPTDWIRHDIGEAKSAKQARSRPGFGALAKLIRSGGANAILTWHPDRLSRNIGDVNTLVELLEDGSLKMIVTPQYIFTNRPMDKYMLVTECTRAKLENDNKGVNVKRGLDSKVRDGWRPGVAPPGYLNNLAKNAGERDIIVDPERFPVVRRLWDLLLVERRTGREIQQIAYDIGLRTRQTRRQGGKPISLSHVYAIFKNPFYYGWYWWTSRETGVRELRKGSHTPMITEDEFRLAQARLGCPFKSAPKSHLFAYAGLIRCGECQSSVTAEEKWQTICGACRLKFASQSRDACPGCKTPLAERSDNIILHYVYYHCTKKRGPCTQRGVRLEVLEAQIDKYLKCFNIHEDFVVWGLNALADDEDTDVALAHRAEHAQEERQGRARKELADLKRFMIRQDNEGWTLMSRDDALAEKGRLEAHLIASPGVDAEDGFLGASGLLTYACRSRAWFRVGTVQQKRAIVEALGSNLTLKDQIFTADLDYPLREISSLISQCPKADSALEPDGNLGPISAFSNFDDYFPSWLAGSVWNRVFEGIVRDFEGSS